MNSYKESLESNVKKIYIFKFLKWFLISSPISFIFYKENGISTTEIMTLHSIYSVSMVLFEIPSGYIADIIGRKKVMILSSALAFLSFSIYSFAHTFLAFAIFQIILGLATSLSTGSDSALLYDTLYELKKTKDYKKDETKMLSIESFSEATASILGGTLAMINMRYNIYAETFFIFISLILAFFITEPKTIMKVNTKKTLFNSFEIIKGSFKENNQLKWFVIYSAIISSGTLTFATLIQPYLKSIEVEVAFLGIIWALLRYSVTIFSMFTSKVEALLGERKTLVSFTLLVFISYMLLSCISSKLGIAVFFIIYFTRSFNKPILKNNINNLIPSEIRATMLSITSFICRCIFSIIAPILGYITDKVSISSAFFLAGIIHLFLSLFPLFFLLKSKEDKCNEENLNVIQTLEYQ